MNPRSDVLRRAVSSGILALLALGMWGSAPASADDAVAIDHASPTHGAVRLLISVPGVDPVNYGSVKVTLDGNDVTAQAAPARPCGPPLDFAEVRASSRRLDHL